MITVDEVLKNLSSNTNLNEEVKNNLKELILIFNKRFPDADLTNLNSRIGSLNIVAANKYVIKEIVKYDINENVLRINTSELSKDFDAKNILMHHLLNIISCRNVKTGYIKSSAYLAVHEGYASIIANNLVGNKGEKNPYQDEEILVNLLGQITSFEEIETAYFSNNSAPLIGHLLKMHNTPKDIKDLMDLAKYNLESRSKSDYNSQLGDIQKRVITMFSKKANITAPEISNFKNYLYGDSAIFDNDRNKYKGIDGIYKYYDEVTASISFDSPVLDSKSR